MPPVYEQIFLDFTEDEIMNMSRGQASLGLNDQERSFCENYIHTHNNKTAAIKANFSPGSASKVGWRLRKRPGIQLYLAWLRLRVCKECHVSAVDMLDQYARLAFADITDFVTISNSRVKIKDSDHLDGQLIKAIKQSSQGVHIELHDKMVALDRLDRYLNIMPKDWKQKLEERKVSLLEEKLELEKLRAGILNDVGGDDGLIEALMSTAEEIWTEDEMAIMEDGDIGDEE